MNKGKQTRFHTSWLDESEYLRQCDLVKRSTSQPKMGWGMFELVNLEIAYIHKMLVWSFYAVCDKLIMF